jgi:hypothetical protein
MVVPTTTHVAHSSWLMPIVVFYISSFQLFHYYPILHNFEVPIPLNLYTVFRNITDVACHVYNSITTAAFYFSRFLNTLRNVRLILTP